MWENNKKDGGLNVLPTVIYFLIENGRCVEYKEDSG